MNSRSKVKSKDQTDAKDPEIKICAESVDTYFVIGFGSECEGEEEGENEKEAEHGCRSGGVNQEGTTDSAICVWKKGFSGFCGQFHYSSWYGI